MGSSLMFVVSYFCWDEKEREAAHLAEENADATLAQENGWSKVKGTFVHRRSSLDEVFKSTLVLHEATKSHLLKIPSAKLSTVAIVGFMAIYAVVFNPVDVFVLIFICLLNLRLMSSEERGALWWNGFFWAQQSYHYVNETATWLKDELAVKEAEHDAAVAAAKA